MSRSPGVSLRSLGLRSERSPGWSVSSTPMCRPQGSRGKPQIIRWVSDQGWISDHQMDLGSAVGSYISGWVSNQRVASRSAGGSQITPGEPQITPCGPQTSSLACSDSSGMCLIGVQCSVGHGLAQTHSTASLTS